MRDSKGYHAVRESTAWCDRSDRSRLEVAGPDRARFLHNLTTNEVKRLPVHKGCETFVTSPQGKTLAYVKLLMRDASILVCADPGGLAFALPHFQKYGVFEDVALEDRSAETFEVHLAGPGSEEPIRSLGGELPEAGDLSHCETEIAGCPLLLFRESPTGVPGLTLIGDRSGAERVAEALRGCGLAELDHTDFEALRIEAGTPVFGREINDKNLPQEIGRDNHAINFVKGCYLGQETVARLDALGHVNQILKGLLLEPGAATPAPGSLLEAEGKSVGTITSAVFSPGRNAPAALAMVRRSHARAGAVVSVREPGDGAPASATATVCDLPMPAAAGPHGRAAIVPSRPDVSL